MFEALKTTLSEWNQTTSEKQKLQHSYVLLLVVVIFLAGLVSLFNGNTSRLLMYVALALITTLTTNYLVWSLLKTTLLDKLPKPTRVKRS